MTSTTQRNRVFDLASTVGSPTHDNNNNNVKRGLSGGSSKQRRRSSSRSRSPPGSMASSSEFDGSSSQVLWPKKPEGYAVAAVEGRVAGDDSNSSVRSRSTSPSSFRSGGTSTALVPVGSPRDKVCLFLSLFLSLLLSHFVRDGTIFSFLWGLEEADLVFSQ